MRQSIGKSNGLPKLETPKRLDFTVTGTASALYDKLPATRPSLSSIGVTPSNLQLKQVSFQCLGDFEGEENLEARKSVSQVFSKQLSVEANSESSTRSSLTFSGQPARVPSKHELFLFKRKKVDGKEFFNAKSVVNFVDEEEEVTV